MLPRREPGIDLARGLAVLGMFAAHTLATPTALSWSDPSSWAAVVNGNSSILFATLAGVSLGLVTGGSAPRLGAPRARDRARIAVRAAVIFALGIALWILPTPVYVILPAYAILFLLALPLIALRPAALLIFAGVVAVASPFLVRAIDASPFWSTDGGEVVSALIGWHYPFVAWIAFVAAGLAVSRIGFASPRRIAAMGLGGGIVSAVGFAVLGRVTHPAFTAVPHETGIGEMLGSGGLAIAATCACVLVCRTVVSWVVWPLRAVGSMPLTAYAAQLVAWGVWALMQPAPEVAMFDFRGVAVFWLLTIATIIGCSLWAVVIGRGPLEWAVRGITHAVVRGR